MKISEKETMDRYGVYPCCWVSGKDATPQNLHEWLFDHYQGYKFMVVFDCTKDEFEEPDNETPVYFLDTVLEEILEYVGVDKIKEWVQSKTQN